MRKLLLHHLTDLMHHDAIQHVEQNIWCICM